MGKAFASDPVGACLAGNRPTAGMPTITVRLWPGAILVQTRAECMKRWREAIAPLQRPRLSTKISLRHPD